MITKRTILNIQERVQSAVDRLQPFVDKHQEIGPTVVEGVLQRDLSQALEDLGYVFSLAD